MTEVLDHDPDALACDADDAERDARIRRIAEHVNESPWVDVRETLSRSERTCVACGTSWPPGTVWWSAHWARAGSQRGTWYLCFTCPWPAVRFPCAPLAPGRVAAWARRSVKVRIECPPRGKAGRPPTHFTRRELLVLREFREMGFGRRRQAREFLARTGRRLGDECFRDNAAAFSRVPREVRREA